MRLFEFADAESQMELWKLITDSVWQAIAKQAQEQKQLDAQRAKTTSAAPSKSSHSSPRSSVLKQAKPRKHQLKRYSDKKSNLTLLNPSLRRLLCQVVVLLLQLGKISLILCLSIKQRSCLAFPQFSRQGRPSQVSPNQLQRQFQQDEADQVWVTDITYIRTYEGWLYLAVVLDLHSRAVVGWSMRGSMETTLVLDALTMAVWRRRPKGSVIIHSDQGSQFGSDEFSRWCKENRLSPSMSRRGNCWDNAVAESFFSNLKSEKIKKRIYKTRQEARSEVFEYIEGFYNPVRRHKHLDQLSPLEFERRQIAL
jgi:putative transposase